MNLFRTAAVLLATCAVVPHEAWSATPPRSVVLSIQAGATGTSSTVVATMTDGSQIKLGDLDPTNGVFRPVPGPTGTTGGGAGGTGGTGGGTGSTGTTTPTVPTTASGKFLAAARLRLTQQETVYVDYAHGSDANGNGTQLHPYKTRTWAYQAYTSQYDINGQTVVFQLVGNHPDSVQASGQVVGVNNSSQIIFRGNVSNPGSVLVQPVRGTGYCYSAAYGAKFRIEGQKLDMTLSYGQDTMAIGQGGFITIGAGVILGNNLNPGNHCSIAFGGQLNVTSDYATPGNPAGYTIQVDTVNILTSIGAIGATTINVSDTSNLLLYMGLTGVGIAPDTYVAGITSATQIVISRPTVATTPTNSPLTASWGGQCHIDYGAGATGYFETNGTPGLLAVNIIGVPYFLSGFILANEGSQPNIQSVTWHTNGSVPAGVNGLSRTESYFSKIDTYTLGVPYLPGNLYVETSGTFGPGQQIVQLASTAGMKEGQLINGLNRVLAGFGAGVTNISVGSLVGLTPGAFIQGTGLSTGTYIQSINRDNYSVAISSPTLSAQTNITMLVNNIGIPNDTHIAAILSSTSVLLTKKTIGSSTGLTIRAEGVSDIGIVPQQAAWIPYTPVVGCTSGSLGGYTASGSYTQIGSLVVFRLYATVTSNGSAAGVLTTSLPVPANVANGSQGGGVGREAAVVGKSVMALVGVPDASHAALTNYDGTYPGITGGIYPITITYEAA